jgi:hypothetical protein
VRRRWVIAVLGVAGLLAALGLAGLLPANASFWDGQLARQRQQAADALDRWAAAAASADGGEVNVVPPAWDPFDPPVGLTVESVEVSTDERLLLATFTGSPDPASEPCGIDYTGEAVESDLAVVVIIVQHRRPWPETCADIGAVRTTMVALAAPLGDRAVLDAVQGLPVEVLRP